MVHKQDSEIVDERFEGILREIIHQLNGRERKDKVSLALFWLLVREANTWRTIRVLRKQTPAEFRDAFMVDAGTLLRAMFDAYLQANYIFGDPANRAELASQYLDYEHVERQRIMQNVLGHGNALTNRLRSSPHKREGESRVKQEYDRVKDQFVDTGHKWYRGSLSGLARAAGKEIEYDTFVASFSGCVHSSAFALQNGPMVKEEYVLFLASTFAARVAKLNVEYNQLDIADDRMILDELCKSWLDGEGPATAGRTVTEILDEIARNRFKPDPDGPSVVDMLREDRNR